MMKLRANPIIAARDYYYSYVIYEEELLVARGAGYFRRLADCFTVPRIRRSNYGASTVMLAQQMCGINSKLECRSISSSTNVHSHFLLQLDYLRECGIYLNPGLVRIAWLRGCPGGVDHSYSLPNRYERPSDFDLGRELALFSARY